MCCDNREQLLDQLNPTFLFTWKGTRLKDEARYHSHDFIDLFCPATANTRLRTGSMMCPKEISLF